jgi:hypothetical protein
VNDHATSSLFFNALYDGDGLRVKKTDTRGALGLQVNDFSYGPQGLLWSSNPNTVHTPGFGHRSQGAYAVDSGADISVGPEAMRVPPMDPGGVILAGPGVRPAAARAAARRGNRPYHE